MKSSTESGETTSHEMSTIGETQPMKGAGLGISTGSSRKSNCKTTEADLENVNKFRQMELEYQGGNYEVIANENPNLPNEKKKPEEVTIPEALCDSVLATMTQPMLQQMDLFRRRMYCLAVILFIVFLIAAASLLLAVFLTTGKFLTSNRRTSSSGMVPFSFTT